ncbi:hypothetical protein CLOP_g9494 [Closterium sp. NIES-67]|nr:hypothetical protein CLOP_g9494 [Closterium sp. NIES-67]
MSWDRIEFGEEGFSEAGTQQTLSWDRIEFGEEGIEVEEGWRREEEGGWSGDGWEGWRGDRVMGRADEGEEEEEEEGGEEEEDAEFCSPTWREWHWEWEGE